MILATDKVKPHWKILRYKFPRPSQCLMHSPSHSPQITCFRLIVILSDSKHDGINYTDMDKAPVSKGLLGTSVVTSIALNIPLQNYQPYFIYTTQQILQKQQIWRLFTSKLAFLDMKDLFICSLLIYYFRIFERRFGSRKFASYLLGTGLLATLLELLCLYLCQNFLDFDITSVPSGPLCLVFPMFVPYYYDIPRVAMTTIVGVPVTGKTFTYILGLQIASTSAESRLAAVCSIVAGLLWRLNFVKLQTVIQIPKCVAKVCDATIGRLLKSSPPKNTRLPMGATLELQRQEQLDRLEQQMLWSTFQNPNHLPNGNAQQQNLFQGLFGNNNIQENLRQRYNTAAAAQLENQEPEQPVSEEQVQQLVDMGFNADRVRTALRMSNNDVTTATSVLLRDL
ncbi:ubiquitin-associated domain-containing protein 2 isoform X2 [Patella vulgata]|uniref:ubiquitin-associated domain-containing protein 2 isoform X2 n=1 Tax=Patella vulgata TaxID=6465 RepID=UPI0021801D50|nr:ubiquitin-associated domain-containing protein 2 isoform X2 [Patella vulgata]